MGRIERLCAELFSEANLTERDKQRPLANYGRINGRRRALEILGQGTPGAVRAAKLGPFRVRQRRLTALCAFLPVYQYQISRRDVILGGFASWRRLGQIRYLN